MINCTSAAKLFGFFKCSSACFNCSKDFKGQMVGAAATTGEDKT